MVETIDQDNNPETFSTEETGQKLHALATTGYFEEIGIEEDATREALASYLSTGDLDAANKFFGRNYDPEVTQDMGLLTGPDAFIHALELMELPIPPGLETPQD